MQRVSSQPPTADIRQFFTDTFSDEELSTLCSDYFRDVYEDFAAGMTKSQKIRLLLDYCQHRDVIPSLLAAIQRTRPEQYAQRFSQAPKVKQEPPKPRDSRRVFVSHAHQDVRFAHHLASDLQNHGWRTWIAPDDIRPGEMWVEAINRGLEESGVVVLVLTPNAVKSDWVKQETNAAIQLDKQGKLRFVPLDIKKCDVPPMWDVYQRISFHGPHEDGLRALLNELELEQKECADKRTNGELARRDDRERTRWTPRFSLLGLLLLLLLVSLYVIWPRDKDVKYTLLPTATYPVGQPKLGSDIALNGALRATPVSLPVSDVTPTPLSIFGAKFGFRDEDLIFQAKKCPSGISNPNDPVQCNGTYTTSLSLNEGDAILVKFHVRNLYAKNNIDHFRIRVWFDPKTIYGQIKADDLGQQAKQISISMENELGFQTFPNSSFVSNWRASESRWSDPIRFPDVEGYSPFFFPSDVFGYDAGAFPFANEKVFYFALQVRRLSPVLSLDRLFRVSLVDEDGKALAYSSEITVTAGDKLRFLFYIHNEVVGTLAQNLMLETWGIPIAGFSSSIVVTGSVTADNAVPSSRSNSVKINPSSEGSLKLAYIPNSTGIYGSPNLRAPRYDGVLIQNGIVNAQLLLDELRELTGCYDSTMQVTFDMKVEQE